MKPILFSTEMVQAILAGRKTQTRRVIKAPVLFNAKTPDSISTNGNKFVFRWNGPETIGGFDIKPPYNVGDVLYVREAWTRLIDVKGDLEYFYRADMENPTGHYKTAWHPSTHMPLDAARLFLRVTDVRAERVQAIKVDDAWREGFEGFHHKNPMLGNLPEIVWNFQNEWDARNAKRGYGWDSNPWVWVIEFEKCNPE